MDSLFVDSTALLAIQDTLMVAQTAVATACDSVAQVVAAPITQDSIARLLHTIVENTAPDPTPRLGIQMYQWNFWVPIIALIAGLIGTYYGWKGYFFSKKTAENVARLSPDAQYALCRNFAVQLYKNLVRIMVLKYKVKHEKDITQDEIIALHLPKFEDVFFIDAFYKDADAFMKLQKMKVDFQAYDELITHIGKIKKIEESNIQKLLVFTGQLLTQTKDIALLIRKTSTSMKTNSWTIKEAIGNALVDNKREWFVRGNKKETYKRILLNHGLPMAILWIFYSAWILGYIDMYIITISWIPLRMIVNRFFVGMFFYYIMVRGFFGGPFALYILFRQRPTQLYLFKLKHNYLFKTLSFVIYFIFFIIIWIIMKWNISYIGEIVCGLFIFFMISFFGFLEFKDDIENQIERDREREQNVSTQKLLMNPSSAMLDIFIMILMSYHSKHLLSKKGIISSKITSQCEDILLYTKTDDFTQISSIIQTIPQSQLYPNPLYERYDLQRHQLTKQDIQEFMHWTEDIRFPDTYRCIMKKHDWTLNDIETLFIYMCSVDATLETSKK